MDYKNHFKRQYIAIINAYSYIHVPANFFTLNNERIIVNNDVIIEVIICYNAIRLHYTWFRVNFLIEIILIYYYPCCRLGPNVSPTPVQ